MIVMRGLARSRSRAKRWCAEHRLRLSLDSGGPQRLSVATHMCSQGERTREGQPDGPAGRTADRDRSLSG
ncbi:hypothetical protein DF3PA_60025 [Candidatus Defluviicoccus seviourii]|uniref:Uncharacterized protein n=1 Tax=Candidatus Defluviicoccus seviourii TaxID=2565273 RepID=A0A564WGG6_9PROT|nr:hypothetical protein DF3PA_60025 [Candidatus Defluviicoccus seviourii]